MHKKGRLDNLADGKHLVGAMLAQESGFYCDKVQVAFEKLDPKDFPGKLHVHEKMDEIVIVSRGKFVVEMDGERIELGEKEYVFKTAGSPGRALSADPGTEILVIKSPSAIDDVRAAG